MYSLIFGRVDSGLNNTASRWWLPACGTSAGSTSPGSDRNNVVPCSGTIDQLYVSGPAAPGAGKSITYTLLVNGVASALTCTISGASQTANSDTTHSVSVSAGDLISIQGTPSGTPTWTSPIRTSMRFASSDASYPLFGMSNTVQNNSTCWSAWDGSQIDFSAGEGTRTYLAGGGTIKAFYVWFPNAITTGSYTVALEINGVVSGTVTVTITTGNVASVTGLSVLFNAGDKISLRYTRSGTPNSNTGNITHALLITPANAGEFLVNGLCSQGSPSASATNYNTYIKDQAWGATESSFQLVCPCPVVFRNLTVKCVTSPSPGTFTFKFRNGGNDGHQSVTCSNANTTSDSNSKDACKTGDLVSISSTPASTPTTGATISISMVAIITGQQVTPGSKKKDRKTVGRIKLISGIEDEALSDYNPGDTVDLYFTTVDVAGIPATLAGTPAVSVYKDNGTAESTAGITLTTDFDGRTGLNQVRITTNSDGTFYAAGHDFNVVITAGTVSGNSVVGYVVGDFSIQNRNQLRPATAGRTLSVDSNGRVDLASVLGSAINALISGRIDANAQVVGDKTGYALSASGIQAIWDALTSALATVGSIGKRLVDNIDATISSRLASSGYTAPLDAAGTRTAVGLASANLDTQLDAIPTNTDLATALAGLNDISVTDILAAAYEGSETFEDYLRLTRAALVGKLSGAATTSMKMRDAIDSKDRITAAVDADGNRLAVVTDPT